MSDATLYSLEAIGVSLTAMVAVVAAVRAILMRSRPGLRIGQALSVAVALRLGAIALLSTLGTSLAGSLRGGDELTFLSQAHQPIALIYGGTPQLHVSVFAIQLQVLHLDVGALRVTQVTIAVVGVMLLAAAVHDLASPRAATIFFWIAAVEPASVFFDGLIHKEALMTLAVGLAVLGGTRLWRRASAPAVALMVAGSLIAIGTRWYAGYFLAGGCLAMCLHAGLMHARRQDPRSLPVLTLAAVVLAIAIPFAIQQTSSANLQRTLQTSQNTNATDNSNLSLEAVNFSSRADLILNLPRRMFDLVFKPYPWQASNTSQRLGVLGSLFVLGTLWFLIRGFIRSRGHILRRAGPIVYPLLLMLIAFALSVGNAGTGFRYRTDLLVVALALVTVLNNAAARPGDAAARIAPGEALSDMPPLAWQAARNERTGVPV